MKIIEYWELKKLLQQTNPIWSEEVCEMVKNGIKEKLNTSYDALNDEYRINALESTLNSMDEIAKQLEELNS